MGPLAGPAADSAAGALFDEYLERVLDVVRDLARELGGSRAFRAVTPEASLERDIGLGSLERVELLIDLESAFGRPVDDRFLLLDTSEDIARALLATSAERPLPPAPRRAIPVAPRAASEAATLHEALRLHALAEPERPHAYLRGDDGREETITYGALWHDAAAVAAGLRERGIRRGDTVALMLPTGGDFLRAFLGILVAGAVPVPLYPPLRLDRFEEYSLRQTGILVNAGVRCLVTMPAAMAVAHALMDTVPSLVDVTAVEELAQPVGAPRATEGSPDDPALIQYTSGSTGNPKGVQLTHANLIANIRAIAAGVSLSPTDVAASWLPLYHDMGLIGSWLFSLYHGIPIVIQSPMSFLARPERWLWAIHEHRVTLSAAPNFAYELCVRKIADEAIEGLDLSSWRCALNGAEPVSPDTLDRFAKRFQSHGFRREALLPVYGLAECAVALSFPPVGRGPLVDHVRRDALEQEAQATPADARDASAQRFVSVGAPLPGHEVRILDEQGRDLPERAVGRLVFRGPSVMAGYFRNPEATDAVSLPDGWIDSGDLAYRSGGELYVTGRRKDLVIKAGRNLVPQEIEEVAASVNGIRKGCVAAFGVANVVLGTESLVVVAETHATAAAERAALEGEVIARVTARVGVPPDEVVLVAPGTVPKTSSGKIRRGTAREWYLAGSLGRRKRTSRGTQIVLVAGSAWELVRRRLARAVHAVYVGYVALVLALLTPVAWALAAVAPTRRAVLAVGRGVSRLALRLAGIRVTVEGRERLPREGAFLLASNHTSYADIPVLLAALPRDVGFVAKREVLAWPIVGTFARRGRHPTVDRWGSPTRVADAQEITRLLRAGEVLLLFPEGTFAAAAGLRPFRLGAFTAAVEARVPVVPIAIEGARRVLRGDSRWPRPGRVRVWIGEPIAPEGDGWPAVVALRDRVAAAIAEHCGEPRLDTLAATPATR